MSSLMAQGKRVRSVVMIATLLFSCHRQNEARPSPPTVAAPARTEPVLSVDERFEKEPPSPDPDRRRFTRCTEIILGSNGCMVRIPGGRFLMGAQHTDAAGPNYDPDASDDEGPVHEVTLAPYWMHRAEVKAEEYAECVRQGGCHAEEVVMTGGLFTGAQNNNHPINGVTWKGASDYCHWIEGRLPTEAEFEFGARGPEGRRFPCGNGTPSCPQTIMNNGCGGGGTSQVDFTGGKDCSFGLVALAGSVWEWTSDWYGSYGDSAAKQNPTGPANGTRRVIRGGGWMTDNPAELRAAARAPMDPADKMPDVGFRCVRPVSGR